MQAPQQKPDFEKMVTMRPEFGPLNADEEPSPEESEAFQRINNRLLEFIHGPKSDAVVRMMQNSPELYKGVGQAAYQILLSAKQQEEKGGKELPPAALWGEGAGIHTAVDELFQLAQAAGIPGSQEQDQYSAAMFEVYRLAGEHIEQGNDDNAVKEAQELMIDVEASSGPQGIPEGTYGMPHQKMLDEAVQRSLAQQQGGIPPQAAPEPAPQQGAPQGPMPPQGMSGILGG